MRLASEAKETQTAWLAERKPIMKHSVQSYLKDALLILAMANCGGCGDFKTMKMIEDTLREHNAL